VSLYVALDGPDGCGKSAQSKALVTWLRERSDEVLHVREPGSTPVGEALRGLLLRPDTGELRPLTEMLLFTAARAELVARVIQPALARGACVVAERCYLSTLVYQLLAHGDRDTEWFFESTRRAHGDCLPRAVFVLDVPPEVALARRSARERDRFEGRGDDFHRRVREGYLAAASLDVRVQVVDASRRFEAVQQDLRARIAGMLA
jgi:dTMP kinase